VSSTGPGGLEPVGPEPGSPEPGSLEPGSLEPGSTAPGGLEPSGAEPGGMAPGAEPSLELVAAALRADAADAALYARVLTSSLGESLPPGCVSVERQRSMSDRMRGRPGEVSKVSVRLGERVLTLAVERGAPAAEICREVRGVVLSRQPVPVGEWAEELARALVEHAGQNAATASALRRLVTGQ
jgi:hypothetical protein